MNVSMYPYVGFYTMICSVATKWRMFTAFQVHRTAARVNLLQLAHVPKQFRYYSRLHKPTRTLNRFLAAEAHTAMTSKLQSPKVYDLKLSQGCLCIPVNRCIVDIPSALNDMQRASCLELWKALQFFNVSLQHLCGKTPPSSWEPSEIFCCSRAPNSALSVSAPLFT